MDVGKFGQFLVSLALWAFLVEKVSTKLFRIGTLLKRREMKDENEVHERIYFHQCTQWTSSARCQHNLTLQELAEEVKMSVSTLWRAENGSTINAESRRHLCAYFGMTAQELGLLERGGKTRQHSSSTLSEQPSTVVIPAPPQKDVPTIIFKQGQTLDMLNERETTLEQQLGAWLALETCNISSLFDAGWTLHAVLESLRVLLQGVQGLPPAIRRKLLQLSSTAMMNTTIQATECMTQEEQAHIFHMLSSSIVDGWKCFQTVGNTQLLVTGHALLTLIQQYHFIEYSPIIPTLYSSIYRLIGLAQLFQGHYGDALRSYNKAYLTALEISDAWNMAESLGAQAGVWKACGQQEKAIGINEAAIRLITHDENASSHATQARLYAQSAESAALLGKASMVEEMLDESDAHYHLVASDITLDNYTRSYYQGTCALYLNNPMKAAIHFQQALQHYPQSLLLQRANTLLFQAKAFCQAKDWQNSLTTAQKALPEIVATDAPIILWGFVDYIDSLCHQFPTNIDIAFFAKHMKQQLNVQTRKPVSRYLEGQL